MRRGLIEWSKTELPETVFDARIAAMRTAMASAGIDALVAYTNFTRPSAVSWLVSFVPYWSECALVLPASGPLTMVSAVSPRGKPWIESTTYSQNLLFTPRIGPEVARVLKETLPPGATAGVVELEDIPAALGLALRSSGATLVDATSTFVAARGPADAAHLFLARIAADFAHRALAEIEPDETEATAAVGAADLTARTLGAEESYIAIAPDVQRDRRMLRLEGPALLGAVYAVRATVAYKGAWIRMVRTIVRSDAEGIVCNAEAAFAAAIAELPNLGKLAAFDWWLVETARAAQPLEAVAGSAMAPREPVQPGSLVTVQAATTAGGVPVLLGAAAIAGSGNSPGAFLVAPEF